MTREKILSEIRRTAEENGGSPLGIRTFEAKTSITVGDWKGIHWASWGDALREAGFQANTLTPAIDEDQLLERYARPCRQLVDKVAAKADL